MKQYRISIAVRVPLNYELTVSAKNEKEARKMAAALYYDNEGYTDENSIDYDEMELDVNEDAFERGEETAGVYVEEV